MIGMGKDFLSMLHFKHSPLNMPFPKSPLALVLNGTWTANLLPLLWWESWSWLYRIRHRFCYLLWQRHPLLPPLAVGGGWVPPAPVGWDWSPTSAFPGWRTLWCTAARAGFASSFQGLYFGEEMGRTCAPAACSCPVAAEQLHTQPGPRVPFSCSPQHVWRESRDVLTPDLNYNAWPSFQSLVYLPVANHF